MSSRPDFNAAALRFCRVIEDPPRRVSLELLQEELLELYAAAIRLPRRPETPPLPGDARSSFRFHWGAHAADALRALHWKLIGMSRF